MQSGIEALPLDVVHLIAAGEVIDSLAAVVRELAENALDAGASRISISLYPDQWRVRVADNGHGMSLEDLQRAASPHTTSKIRDRQDLTKIMSLGFRGEALYSLAQLADLEIVSRSANSQEGWWVAYDAQGKVCQVEPAAIAPGTVVIGDNIFGNWPARRQGLPPITQQLKAVQAVVHQMALCHPQVTWQVEQNEREWLTLWMGKTARQILPQILRDVQGNDLQEIVWRDECEESPLSSASFLYLLLGLPDRCHRHRPDWIRVALNGRFVQIPEMEQTILAGFRRTLPRDRFPVCFAHFHIPPEHIDWNRHPAKSEVYLHHMDYWREQLTKAIEKALQLSSINFSDTLYFDRVGKVLKTAEAQSHYNASRSQEPGTRSQKSELEPHSSPLRAIAQVHNMYILAEHSTGVWLIEQHIAHERVLYEQLCDRWQIVTLRSPIVLNQLSTAQVEQLQRLEMDMEPFGEQAWVVRTAPELLAQRDDCADALWELSLGGDLQTAQVATACRSAIRNGTPLTLQEMQTLLDQWQQTRNPRTCPHGRPICLTLEESALSRFFRRHWVIGKSHGI
ncbi:DNA mismatch repair endonuclease MutL [Leptothermofonsia sp. ETS-13]|uniref:DNA mismatch repair endonuclease MutL n=1 Tax=Leptothermofonsia sp. ETS-13 TaxID=3035696 RepID=UPI003BA3AF7E